MLLCALNSDFVTGVTGLVYIQIGSYDCEVASAEKLTHLELNKSKDTHNDLTLAAIEHIHHQTRVFPAPGDSIGLPIGTRPPENLYR